MQFFPSGAASENLSIENNRDHSLCIYGFVGNTPPGTEYSGYKEI
jgi:hypothetical protein